MARSQSVARVTWLFSVALSVVGALAACGGEDTVAPPITEPPPAVNDFLTGLPSWSAFSPTGPVQDSVLKTAIDTSEVVVPQVEQVAQGGAIETLTNVPYVCTSAEYEWSRNPEQLVMYSPATDILWPGALIQGKSYKDGALLGLTIAEREPINVSIPALPTGRNFRTIAQVDQAHVASAIGEMLGNATEADLPTGSSTTFRMDTYSSEQSFALSMNASGRYLGFSLAVGGATSRSTSETTVTVHFAQKMFEVVVAPPQSPGAFFSPAFTSERLEQQQRLGRIGPDNLPVYVASVNYGRMMMFSFTSTASESDIKATLNASYKFAVGEAKLELDAKQKKILERARIQITSIGGSDSATAAMIRTGDWRQYFTQAARLSTAQPLSYTFKSLGDGSTAKVWEATRHRVQRCMPRVDIPGPFRFLAAQNVDVPVATPFSTTLGDVNGDGREDLVFNHLSAGTNDVAVALGMADGKFAAATRQAHGQPVPSPEGWSRYQLISGDINGDERMDLVWYNLDKPWRIYSAVATSAGGFTFPDRTQHYMNLGPEYRVALADVDGDGEDDVIWNRTIAGSNRTFIGHAFGDGRFNADGLPALDNTRGAGWAPYRLFTADVNGDGRQDLVWNSISGSNRVYVGVSLPNGGINFLTPQDHPTTCCWDAYRQLAGDFNGDRNFDLMWITTGATANGMHRGFGSGTGRFTYPTFQNLGASDATHPGKGPFEVIAGDVNGDGVSDVIWNRRDGSGNRIAVTRGTNGTSLDPSEPAQLHPDAANWLQAHTLVGDVNGDRQADVLWLIPGGTTRVFVGLAKKP